MFHPIYPNFLPQILSGTYPIAQVREPYSVVGYLAACTPLEKVLNLVHPKIAEAEDENVDEDIEWSAWDICDGNGLLWILGDNSTLITKISKN